ncbi:MAG: endolytic transglycosylase MltG [Candidatus Dormibacteria bacterium]
MRRPWLAGLAVAAVILGVAGFSGVSWAADEVYHPVSRGTGLAVVAIPPNSTTSAIARLVHAAGLIDNELVFVWYVRLSGLDGQLQAGTYAIPRSANLREVVAALHDNQVHDTVVTLIDGWTLDRMAREAARQGVGPATQYLQYASRTNYPYDFLAGLPAGATLEGFLFPDTYRLSVHAGASDLVQLQLKRFGQVFDQSLRAQAQAHGRSLWQAVVMASIVEREARTPADQRQVAEVLWKRVDLGMPLEADATVLYAEGPAAENKTAVLNADLQVDSPYNTYRYAGLPPGPISNPSLSALTAAVDPAPGAYLYYLSDPSGRMYFSNTLDQHNALRRRFYPNG